MNGDLSRTARFIFRRIWTWWEFWLGIVLFSIMLTFVIVAAVNIAFVQQAQRELLRIRDRQETVLENTEHSRKQSDRAIQTLGSIENTVKKTNK